MVAQPQANSCSSSHQGADEGTSEARKKMTQEVLVCFNSEWHQFGCGTARIMRGVQGKQHGDVT